MTMIWEVSLRFPTVLWTAALGVAAAYWLLAVLGILGSDVLDGGAEALDGGAEALDGSAEVLDGGAEALDGSAEVLDGGAEHSLSALTLLSAFTRRKAPMTVKLSLYFLVGWFVTSMVSHYGGALLGTVMPPVGWGAVLVIASALIGLPITAALAWPLDPLFETHHAATGRDLIGKVVQVRTGRVDEHFGQGLISIDGADLLLEVRCAPAKNLGRNDRALLLDFDAESGAYQVEPYDNILTGK